MQKMNNKGAVLSIQRAAWVRQLMLSVMVCATLGFLAGCNNEEDEPAVANANLYAIDREFLEQAVQSNLTEIELGRLAEQKAVDPSVKQYAARMIADHTTAQTELTTLAGTKKWTVTNQLSEANQALRDQLNALSGADFDQAYMRSQVASHQVTAGKFATEIDQGRDNELKAYAIKYKPAIDGHLVMAQDMVVSMGF